MLQPGCRALLELLLAACAVLAAVLLAPPLAPRHAQALCFQAARGCQHQDFTVVASVRQCSPAMHDLLLIVRHGLYYDQQDTSIQRQALMPCSCDNCPAQTAEAKLKAKRDNGIGAISNKSSEHFNIISLSYNPTAEGSKLQQKVSGMAVGDGQGAQGRSLAAAPEQQGAPATDCCALCAACFMLRKWGLVA